MEDVFRSIKNMPAVEGPVPADDKSHPFCSMKYSRGGYDLADFGYVEEEFFLSGSANVYDESDDGKLLIKQKRMPYKNRIIVRRPKDKTRYSGRVYMDILNASNNYDVEDFWMRSYRWCLENGHAYVGVTTKPVCVLSLKYFDYERYQSLDWSSGEAVSQPAASHPVCASIPGTEEGLVWDILSQTALLVRYGGQNNCIGGYKADYLYLTGQSQSGAYLNTYINHFNGYLYGPDNKKLYDGYMNMVGVQLERFLSQRIGNVFFNSFPRRIKPVDTPTINITSEGDLKLLKGITGNEFVCPKDSDSPENKMRYYEVAGSAHSDITVPVLPNDEEIAKTKNPVSVPGENPVNDMPLAYYIIGLLEKLHIWASKGQPPQTAPLIEKGPDGMPVRDEHGNAKGGLRSAFLDVPAASYSGYGTTPIEEITGTMEYFSAEKMKSLYGDANTYLKRFNTMTDEQAEQGWITKSDADSMKQWAIKTANRSWKTL